MSDSLFDAPPAPATNATEYTVSEISGALKRAVEDQFGNVRVRGEISGYRGPHSSGHAYFALKDDRAKIDAVVWRTTMQRLKFRPEEGMEVIATGKLTTYPGKSSYQIIIDKLEPAGAGALMALLEERKRRLQAEGLFDAGRKRPLPFMPRVIGVITSPTGAVIRDILHRIRDRFPLHVIVWPVRVQGETSGAEVASAIHGFNEPTADWPRPDLLIVARGGGSLEDLWGFNDEALARAVAASRHPRHLGGRPRDRLDAGRLCRRRAGADADGRGRNRGSGQGGTRGDARQPVGASRPLPHPAFRPQAHSACRRSPGLADARPAVRHAAPALRRGGQPARTRLDRQPRTPARALRRGAADAGHAGRRLAEAGRHLATCGGRIDAAHRALMRDRRSRFQRVLPRLSIEPLARRTALCGERLGVLMRRKDQAVAIRLERLGARLAQADRLLNTLSHQAILARGFALVLDEDGNLLRQAAEVADGQVVSIQFADAVKEAIATGGGQRFARRRSSKKTPPAGQGSLF